MWLSDQVAGVRAAAPACGPAPRHIRRPSISQTRSRARRKLAKRKSVEANRQQYRRYEPLANVEFVEIGHIGRLFVAAGAQRSQSPMTAGEARADIEDIVTLCRITRPVATFLSGLG